MLSLILGGCADQGSSGTPPQSTATNLTRTQVFELLKEASMHNNPFSSKTSVTKKELYDYYDKYFTQQYVDNVVLSNLKENNDKWILAHPESELKKGTFFTTSFNDQTIVQQTKETITVTNNVEDGLYPAHQEQITLIFVNNQWKINALVWN